MEIVVIILRKNNRHKMSMAFQPNFVNQLPKIVNKKDDDDYKNTILGIDEILRFTGLDFNCAMQYLMVKYSTKNLLLLKKIALCNESLSLFNSSHFIREKLSIKIAESTLLQRFLLLENLILNK